MVNGQDPNDVHTKASQIKLEYNHNQPEFWFNQLEAKMRFAGIESQWTKLQVVITLIPSTVAEEVKHLLRVSSQAAASPTCYKDVKDEIIQLFGRQEEDTFEAAYQLENSRHSVPRTPKIAKLLQCCPGDWHLEIETSQLSEIGHSRTVSEERKFRQFAKTSRCSA